MDYSKVPEELVYIYGPHFFKLPYFERYASVATILAEALFIIQPGRKASLLAAQVALFKKLPAQYGRKDKILEAIAKHREENLPMPVIAEDL